MPAALSPTLANLTYNLDGVVGCTPEQIAAMDAEAAALGLVRVAAGVYVTEETAEQESEAVFDSGDAIRIQGELCHLNGRWTSSDIHGDLLDHAGKQIGRFIYAPPEGSETFVTLGRETHSIIYDGDGEEAIPQWLCSHFHEADFDAVAEEVGGEIGEDLAAEGTIEAIYADQATKDVDAHHDVRYDIESIRSAAEESDSVEENVQFFNATFNDDDGQVRKAIRDLITSHDQFDDSLGTATIVGAAKKVIEEKVDHVAAYVEAYRARCQEILEEADAE